MHCEDAGVGWLMSATGKHWMPVQLGSQHGSISFAAGAATTVCLLPACLRRQELVKCQNDGASARCERCVGGPP